MPPPRALVAAVSAICSAFATVPLASASTLYVTNERSGDVTVIDTRTNAVRATWPVGKRPRGVHLSPDGSRLYVAVSGSPIIAPGAHADRAKSNAPDKAADGIAIIDTATGKLIRKLSVGSDPEQFALTRDGQRIVVSNEDEATATCWDTESGRRIFSTPVSEEPEGVAVNPAVDEVYITCEQRGDVFVLDAGSGAKLGSVYVRGRPRSVAFLPDGSRAYIPAEGEAGISVMDTSARRILQTITVAGEDVMPMCAITAPSGKTIYVSTGRGNSVAVIDVAKNTVATVIPVGKRPWGIVLSADGSKLYSANGKSDDVSIVDTTTRKELSRIKAGQGPWGVALQP